MTQLIAESIFWGAIIVAAVFVYQAAVLLGIRLNLRYQTFALRDRLRSLVIDGTVNESDAAFQLLHQRLNYMCVSMSRYDLARLVQSMKSIDEEMKAQVAIGLRTMESAPVEIRKVYDKSLHICIQALIFNSLFFFILATTCLVPGLLIKVGITRLKEALVDRVHEDSKVGFFAPELAAV